MAKRCPRHMRTWRPDQVAESMVNCYSMLYATLWSFVPDMEERMQTDGLNNQGLFEHCDPKYGMAHYWKKLSGSEKVLLLHYWNNPE